MNIDEGSVLCSTGLLRQQQFDAGATVCLSSVS